MRILCSPDKIITLSPDQVRSALDVDRGGDCILLDVRQPEEYQAGHIPGATFIPLGELEQRQEELDRSKKIITYCRTGRRSMGAAVLLCGLGFKKLYTLGGGILGWRREMVTGSLQEGMSLLEGISETGDILLLAFRLEKGSWDFYSRAGDRLEKKSRILSLLRNTEEEHMQRIYKEMTRYWKDELPPFEELKQGAGGEHTEAGIPIKDARLKLEGYFRRYTALPGGEDKEDLEIMETALEMECKAYDLYKRMRDHVDDSGMRELFQKLAAAERQHIQQLSGELKHFL